MRTRLAVLPLIAALALPGLAACSEETQTTVTEEGVIETPTNQPNGGVGPDARSGDPLAPSDPTTNPSVPVSSPSPS